MKSKNITLMSGAPYQKMYTVLFNAITDALELLEANNKAKATGLLKRAQQEAEELYISQQ